MKYLLILFLLPATQLAAQELYVYTQPASNMAAQAIALKLGNQWVKNTNTRHIETRQMPQLFFGLNKKWMVSTAVTFSNMYSSNYRLESAQLYAKYRFFSKDGLHKHFRMAAFAQGAYSLNNMVYQELSLDGDQSGVKAGIVATQLLHKLALSANVGVTEILNSERWNKTSVINGLPTFSYQSFNYSLSGGYLLLPATYKSYKQVNVNIYTELLGQQALDNKLYYIDLAPAIQVIFNSQLKLNAGYRFQLGGNMYRMSTASYLLSAEWLFLNALKK